MAFNNSPPPSSSIYVYSSAAHGRSIMNYVALLEVKLASPYLAGKERSFEEASFLL